MSVAKETPYFSLCRNCGKHGHIVYADDELESDEFETISDGLDELAVLVASGKISWDESLEVKLQIEESKLKSESRAADENAYAVWLITQDVLEQQMLEENDDRQESVVRRKRRVLN